MAKPKKKKRCRRCRTKPANRARGLCWTCYYLPDSAEQFPSTSKFAVRGDGPVGFKNPPPPPERTLAPPGSLEKMRVMRWRLLNGYQIHHPQDCKTVHFAEGPFGCGTHNENLWKPGDPTGLDEE